MNTTTRAVRRAAWIIAVVAFGLLARAADVRVYVVYAPSQKAQTS